MLHSRLLRCPALVLALCGVGSAGGSARELAGPASLAEQLHSRLIALMEQSDPEGRLPTSPKTVGEVKAALDLVVGRFPEFVENYDACNQTFEWGGVLSFNKPSDDFVENYAKLDQDPRFLYRLGKSYLWILGIMDDILGLWWENKLGCLDALAKFLGASVEALRVKRELNEYWRVIFQEGLLLLQCIQEDAAGSDQGAERAKRDVCAKYEELAKGATDLFGKMLMELESILSGLEDAQRTRPYRIFQESLTRCFGSVVKLSDDLKEWESRLMAGDQKMPSEIQDRMNVEIFRKLLEFKRKFPNLDHEHEDNSLLFPRCSLFQISNGPPLIEEGTPELPVITDFLQRPESDEYLLANSKLWGLKNWTWSLHLIMREDGDRSVSYEQAKLWLGDVERNLCMVLDTIDFADRRQALCALARLLRVGLEHVAALAEGIWGILQEAGKLGREEDGRGRLLTKLEQAIESVSREGPGSKNARSTREPEEHEGGDQQGSDCCQQASCPTGPEPDLREEGDASLAAGL